MKKIFSKKTLSAFLAAIMVLAMIPMGMISAVAETRTLPTVPDGATVIDSAAKWNELAGTITEGDVVLTANIDFEEIPAETLFVNFTGTFNGNGNTISGTSVDGNNLIATALEDGTITNVTIDGFTITGTANNASLVAGSVKGEAVISYITANNCTVNAASYNDSGILIGTATEFIGTINNCNLISCDGSFSVSSAGILGSVSSGSTDFTISNCSVSADSTNTSTIKGSGSIGAIIGKINGGPTVNISNCNITNNVKVEYNGTQLDYETGNGLILGQAGTSTSGSIGLTIQNCTVEGEIDANITNKYSHVGGMVGMLGQADGYTAKFNNNTVNATVKALRGNIGGIIGSFYIVGTTGAFNIDRCNVAGSISDYVDNSWSGGGVAGIVGCVWAKANATSVNSITNCNVTATIASTSSKSGLGTAGIVGSYGMKAFEDNNTGNTWMKTTLNVNNCYIGSEISKYSNAKSAAGNGVGGVVGFCCANGTTINVSDVIFNASFPKNTGTDATGAGLILSASWAASSLSVNTRNCYSINARNMYSSIKNIKVNGSSVNIEKGASYSDDTLKIITAEQATALVSKNNGYINGVAGGLVGTMKAQVSNVVDGKYIIRFVMPAYTENMSGITMTIKVKNGDTEVHTYEIPCTMWDKLTGYDGRTGFTEYTPSTYGAKKLLAGAIVGVPTDANYTFEISTTFTVNDVEITSTAYGAQVTVNGDSVSVN